MFTHQRITAGMWIAWQFMRTERKCIDDTLKADVSGTKAGSKMLLI